MKNKSKISTKQFITYGRWKKANCKKQPKPSELKYCICCEFMGNICRYDNYKNEKKWRWIKRVIWLAILIISIIFGVIIFNI